ncbi:probable 3-hydroxyisobutyrate dehydrogenase-like 1, mitochondrial [Vigna angularis]|uniref:probable 3-hydroxyisobutyrate dehydrogenase-like 1, mitochondrial n=1 Tax=Phaseolus angularis TaxID=3914 RepID=UPI00080A7047|nr:probable 3-hydroxyisobutyrate dehydrogenase-like 1, mitochondrial [Vigna angularis]
MSSLEKEPMCYLLINCCKPSKTESEQKQEQPTAGKGCHSVDAPVSGDDQGAKNGTLSIFAGGEESTVKNLEPLFSVMGKVNYMGGSGKGQFKKLANQVTIASTMVGLVEGMVYAHKAGLDVGLYLEAVSIGVAGSKSLDLYGKRILKRDFEAGFAGLLRDWKQTNFFFLFPCHFPYFLNDSIIVGTINGYSLISCVIGQSSVIFLLSDVSRER